jgi:hypothetical protein
MVVFHSAEAASYSTHVSDIYSRQQALDLPCQCYYNNRIAVQTRTSYQGSRGDAFFFVGCQENTGYPFCHFLSQVRFSSSEHPDQHCSQETFRGGTDQIFGTPIHRKKPVNIELTPIEETLENKINCWNAKSWDSRLVYYVLNLVPNSVAIFIMFSSYQKVFYKNRILSRWKG